MVKLVDSYFVFLQSKTNASQLCVKVVMLLLFPKDFELCNKDVDGSFFNIFP